MVVLEGPPEPAGLPLLIKAAGPGKLGGHSLGGDVLWIDSRTVLGVRDATVIALDTGNDLGTLPSVPRTAATDKVSLIAVVDQGIAAYHLTQ